VKKTTAIAILSVILLLAALIVGLDAVRASRPYLDCASRLIREAPPGDRLPPENFRRLSRENALDRIYQERRAQAEVRVAGKAGSA
jgi:hypothetical protein